MFLYVEYDVIVSDIDDCQGVVCQNGGSCVDGIEGYTCDCVLGFTGEHCETSKH